jgi:hypothetical protein
LQALLPLQKNSREAPVVASRKEESRDEIPAERRWNIPRLLLTGVVTSVFTVAAGYLTDRLTTREPKLQYDLSEGPPLSSLGLTRRIYVVKVTNGGGREVEEPFIGISISGGILQDVSLARSLGFQVTETRDSSSYQVQAPFLNPKDTVAISFLTASVGSSAPSVVVRGRGLRGQRREQSGTKSDEGIFAALTGASVASLAAMAGLLRTKTRKQLHLVERPADREHRRNLIAYALGRAGLSELSAHVRYPNRDVAYREIADDLLLGVRAGRVESERAVATLAAFLSTPWLNADSRAVIHRALGLLNATPTLADTAALHRDATPVELRDTMDEIIASALKESPEHQPGLTTHRR